MDDALQNAVLSTDDDAACRSYTVGRAPFVVLG